MRDPAVIEQVGDRPAEARDEIEIRRRAGEEAGGDPTRQRARRRLFRCARAREQRAGQCVR
jgi:hypothetical protein